MLATRITRAKHAYQPMIQFLGQRKNLVHEPHAPAPHPAAPKEIKEDFQSFLAKLQSTSKGAEWPSSTPKGQSTKQSAQGKTPDETGAGSISKSQSQSGSGSSGSSAQSGSVSGFGKASKPADYENYWEAPAYYWRTREVSEREMEAIESGGATDIRSGP